MGQCQRREQWRGEFSSCPHCLDSVNGENSSQIMKGNSLAVTLSMARTVTGEFISNREGKLTAVTVSTARTVTGEFISDLEGRPTALTVSTARTVIGEFISSLEGRPTAVTVSTARTVTGEFISDLERETHCPDSVHGENSDRGIDL